MRKIALLFAFLVLLALGGAVGFVVLSWNLPSVASLQRFRPPVSSEVFSDEYVKIGEFFRERRIYVPLHDAAPFLVKAFVAAEDAEFFEHKGVSPTGIFRAFVKNMAAGQVRQGGSTITQQVAKALLLTPERSFVRKAREVLLALKMEKFLTKEQILEIYLNQVYLGSGAYGIQAAAQTYFDKDVAGLTPSEMALLAGLTKAPSRDSPFSDFEKALGRRNYVLKRMLEEGYITQQQHDEAVREPPSMAKDADMNLKFAPYLVEYVRRHVTEKYGEDLVLAGGLQIYTTARVRDSLAAARAVRAGLEELDRHQGYRGAPERVGEKERAAFLAKLRKDQPEPPKERDAVLKGLVTEVRDKDGWTFVDLGFGSGAISFETMRWARKPDFERYWENALITRPSQAFKSGDVVSVRLEQADEKPQKSPPKGTRIVFLFQEPLVQAALVSIDPADGAIRAMVGGYDFQKSEFNRAVQAKRQPGSAFKPIIYSAALDNGFTPSRVIVDSPIVYDDPTRASSWKPKNFEGDFAGDTIFRDCLIKSRNVPTVKILQEIGIDAAINYAHKFGITSELAKDYSLALGSSAVVPLDLVTAYAVFATGGRRVTPVAIRKIVDREGNVLERNLPEDPALGIGDQVTSRIRELAENKLAQEAVAVGKDPKAQLPDGYVLSPQTAFLMTHLLKEVIRVGTGARAAAINRPAAGKTGTTNENYDAWFLGFTPDLLAGVWVGFDQASSLGVREMGGASASPIWLAYMLEALKGKPVLDFSVPAGVVFAQIDPKTGKLATSKIRNPIFEAFREGTEPKETADEAQKKKSQQNFFLNE
ncbi:MAG: PBP1A family penicillin-binding protein [Pseudomonadota bacterium]